MCCRSEAGGPPCHFFMGMLPSFCFQAVALTIGAEDLFVRRAPFIKPNYRKRRLRQLISKTLCFHSDGRSAKAGQKGGTKKRLTKER